MRLLILTLGWAAGLVFAAALPHRTPNLWLAAMVIAFSASFILRRQASARWTAVLLAVTAAGGLRLALVPPDADVSRFNNQGGLTVEGVVVAPPQLRDTALHLDIEVDSLIRGGERTDSSGRVRAQTLPGAKVSYGDRVQATGLLVTPGESDRFSYADYLARRGIHSQLVQASVSVVSGGHGNPVQGALLNLREQAAGRIAAGLPEPYAGLLSGILLGDESRIAPEVADAFAATGTAHILAISGFNMVIISQAVSGTLRRLRLDRRLTAALTIGLIALYTVFVGANAAVVRAAIMSALLTIGLLLRRRTYVPASLAFVALVMSLADPFVLWDVGFQLSLGATFGLALFATPLSRWIDRQAERALPGRPAAGVAAFITPSLATSLAAQVFAAPLAAWYFGRLSLMLLPVNLLVLPVQTAVLLLGGAATALSLVVPSAASVAYWPALAPLAWTTSVIRLFARLPLADMEVGIAPASITAYTGVLVAGAMIHAVRPEWMAQLSVMVSRRRVLWGLAGAYALLLALAFGVVLSRPDGRLHVWFLDQGHSNAVLVQSPGGAQLLVDGGRYPSRLLAVLGDRLPFYDRALEMLALTQPDTNEYAALLELTERYDVRLLLTHGQPNLEPDFVRLMERFTTSERVIVRAGSSVELDDGLLIDVLHPFEQPALGASLDFHALTLRLAYGDVSFLLTGDLSAAAQEALLERQGAAPATVLQLPQHGAARSLHERFLAAVQPQVVALQSDPANRRGDPSPDTLTLLGNTPVWRTDEVGAIHFWTDGETLWAAGERIKLD